MNSSSVNNEVRRRDARHNLNQKRVLVDYMQQHPDFAAGRFLGVKGRETIHKKWEELTEIMNATGPAKSVEQWRKAWKDMKGRARSKFAAIRQMRNRTGNPTTELPPLTDIDRLVLSIVGPTAAKGLNTPESLPEDIASLRSLRSGDETPLQNVPSTISLYSELDLGQGNTEDPDDEDLEPSNYGPQIIVVEEDDDDPVSQSLLALRPVPPPVPQLDDDDETQFEREEQETNFSSSPPLSIRPTYPSKSSKSSRTSSHIIAPTSSCISIHTTSHLPVHTTSTITSHSAAHTTNTATSRPTPSVRPSAIATSNNTDGARFNTPCRPAKRPAVSSASAVEERSTPTLRSKRRFRGGDLASNFLKIQEQQTETLQTLSDIALRQAETEARKVELLKKRQLVEEKIARDKLIAESKLAKEKLKFEKEMVEKNYELQLKKLELEGKKLSF